MDRKIVYLHTPQQAAQPFNALKMWIKEQMDAGKSVRVAASLPTRTLEQNDYFHKLCGEIAKSGATWAGKRRTQAQWKVLLVSGHAVASKEEVEIVPGLEGEYVNVRESTAQMSVRRSSSLIEYTLAWCALNEVRISAPDRE